MAFEKYQAAQGIYVMHIEKQTCFFNSISVHDQY